MELVEGQRLAQELARGVVRGRGLDGALTRGGFVC